MVTSPLAERTEPSPAQASTVPLRMATAMPTPTPTAPEAPKATVPRLAFSWSVARTVMPPALVTVVPAPMKARVKAALATFLKPS